MPSPDIHQAAIALGSNLGDSHGILQSALQTLAETPEVALQAHSPFYETIAIGPPQPNYLNCCALLQTSLTPHALLQTLLAIEAQFGRVRRVRWGPRLLDLDLLLFDDLTMQDSDLKIPHPRMAERAFVLVPLHDIAPDWIDPISGKTIAALLDQINCSGVEKYTG